MPWGAWLLGLGIGVLITSYFPTLGASGWGLSGLKGFGGLAGFSLSALALVWASQSHPRLQARMERRAGRFLLRRLFHSVLVWGAATAVSLCEIITFGSPFRADDAIVAGLAAMFATWALGVSASSLIALGRLMEPLTHEPS